MIKMFFDNSAGGLFPWSLSLNAIMAKMVWELAKLVPSLPFFFFCYRGQEAGGCMSRQAISCIFYTGRKIGAYLTMFPPSMIWQKNGCFAGAGKAHS
jgi:hypothetical protein